MTETLWKNLIRTIKNSFGRYVAILLIIMLGVGFVAGLKLTQPIMTRVEADYLLENRMFNLRLLSTIGFDAKDARAALEVEGVAAAAGSLSHDFITQYRGREIVLRAQLLTEELNLPELLAGRMPENGSECLADADVFGSSALGQTLVLQGNNDADTLSAFAYEEYTIVGLARSPLYFSADRGTTTLGSGSLSGFVLLSEEGFSFEYYTELYLLFTEQPQPYTDSYTSLSDNLSSAVEPVVLRSLEARYARLVQDAEDEIAEARRTLAEEKADAEAELLEAEEKLQDAEQQLADGEAALSRTRSQLSAAKRSLNEGRALLEESRLQLNEAAAALLPDSPEDWDAALAAGQNRVNAGQQELDTRRSAVLTPLQATLAELEAQDALLQQQEEAFALQQAAYEQLLPSLSAEEAAAAAAQLQQTQAQLQEARAELNAGLEQCRAGITQAEQAFAEAQSELDAVAAQLATFESGIAQYRAAEAQLAEGEAQYRSGYSAWAAGRAKLEEARQEYESGLQELADGKAELEEKVQEAEAEIAQAEQELTELSAPELYVLDRSSNSAYLTFEADSAIVENVAKVFPIFFFLIAALVCSTTMTRMVDDDRTQIGTLRALGYSTNAILAKYLIYSGSAALVGAVAGYFVCGALFPKVIWVAYQMLYKISGFTVLFDLPLFLVLLLVALLCSAGTTWLACRSTMQDMPAQLIRPRTPPAGKRIFLEYLPFLWQRLAFLRKVSLRNIFRFKKRMIMMILGIAGCTALVVTAFGIHDSVADICTYQYEDIMKYDLELSCSDPLAATDLQALGELPELKDALLCTVLKSSGDVHGPGLTKAAQMIVSDDGDLSRVIDLHLDAVPVALPSEGEVVLTQKLMKQCGLSVGDRVEISISDTESAVFLISGCAENYVYNYIYMSAQSYQAAFGREYAPKTVFVLLPEGSDAHAAGAAAAAAGPVQSVSVVSDFKTTVSRMMQSLNAVVLLVLSCAAGLAFIVLFNLGNINISERVREIATLKVLGFYPRETGAYVFRENLLLTILGVLPGLPLGKLLHSFVISQIKVDMVSFKVIVLPRSYLLSLLLVLLFAWLTDLILRRKIAAIHMAEALKSVE